MFDRVIVRNDSDVTANLGAGGPVVAQTVAGLKRVFWHVTGLT